MSSLNKHEIGIDAFESQIPDKMGFGSSSINPDKALGQLPVMNYRH
jgi:hypothetical protein